MKNTLLIILVLVANLVDAQRTVSGLITDKSNNPMEGVTVSVKNANVKTQSDANGKYFIEVPLEFKTLEFAMRKFKLQEVDITGDVINITMRALDDEVNLFELNLEELMNIEVVTATKKGEKISDAPATVRVITEEQIKLFGWRDLKDVFRAIPGIDVSYDVQGEIRTLVTMRGVLGNQKLLILQDGQMQNPITGERFIFGNNIPLNLYKRIEIVYGPSSALYGADAYAGVINMITKDGGDFDGIETNEGYVSTNAYVADITFGNKISENTDLVMGGRIYNGEDFKLHEHYKDMLDYGSVGNYSGNLAKQDKSFPIKNWNLFTKLKYKKLTIGGDWQHEYESQAMSTIPSNYAYTAEDVWSQDLRHMYVKYDIISNEKIDFNATVTVGDYTVNPTSNFTIINGTLTDADRQFKYAYSSYIQGLIQNSWNISDNLSVIMGISYADVKSFPKTQNLANPFTPGGKLEDNLSYFVDNSGYVFGKIGLTDSIFGERNYSNFGSFIQSQYKMTKYLSLTVGARYDYNTIYGSTFNPRAGLVFTPAKRISIKGLFGTAYIQPSNYYRWENWANPFAMHIPNENIKPEKIQTMEISGSYFINDYASISMSIFRNDMTDVIRPIPAASQTGNYPYYNPYRTLIGESVNTGFVEINSNSGSMYSQGAEIEFNFRLRSFGANLAYSYVAGKDNDDDSNIPKVSQNKLNANLFYKGQKFYASLSARYYSDIQAATTNSLYGTGGTQEGGKLPGSTIFYANAGCNFTKSFSISVNAENLFNTKHYGAAPYAESIWIQPRAPQPLRVLFVGIHYRF
ncbi:MAG: TonB-dependent receptor [Bacteroidales bacterium]|nr:TonB-dependent receptor [Bacteroidales bacterium]